METLINKRAVVITGGPCMGKTSIVESLERSGYACIPESGRDIIQKELKSKGDKLPWADRFGFGQEMFKRAVADYRQVIDSNTYTFFDRGIVDTIGYLNLCRLTISDEIRLAAAHYRYYDKVFITPPWPEIYVNDRERKQPFEEAEITYKIMKKVYTDFLVLTKTQIKHLPRQTIKVFKFSRNKPVVYQYLPRGDVLWVDYSKKPFDGIMGFSEVY